MRNSRHLWIVVALLVFAGCGKGPNDTIVSRLAAPLPEWTTAWDKELGLAGYMNEAMTNREYLDWLHNGSIDPHGDRRGTYLRYSQALIAKAQERGMDGTSLSNVLNSIQTNALASASVPFAAHATTLRGKPVWIVTLHRGSCWDAFAYTAEDVVQQGYAGCR